MWWGVRDPRGVGSLPAHDDPRYGLFPRLVDDWTDPPRALFLVTADAERAAQDLQPMIGSKWHPAGEDAVLGATCQRMRIGRGELVLAQPAGEGYALDCLARFGEGPFAVALDGTSAGGRSGEQQPGDERRCGLGPARDVRHLPVGPVPARGVTPEDHVQAVCGVARRARGTAAQPRWLADAGRPVLAGAGREPLRGRSNEPDPAVRRRDPGPSRQNRGGGRLGAAGGRCGGAADRRATRRRRPARG